MLVTLPNGITLTLVQLERVAELGKELGEYQWHQNECKCCVTVHPVGRHDCGYVVGNDGEYEWVEL